MLEAVRDLSRDDFCAIIVLRCAFFVATNPVKVVCTAPPLLKTMRGNLMKLAAFCSALFFYHTCANAYIGSLTVLGKGLIFSMLLSPHPYLGPSCSTPKHSPTSPPTLLFKRGALRCLDLGQRNPFSIFPPCVPGELSTPTTWEDPLWGNICVTTPLSSYLFATT